MGAKSKTEKKTTVILLRQGIGREEVHLPAGATLGDLFRAARLNRADQEILLDGKSVEDSLVLQPGAIISVNPWPRNDSAPGSWRQGLGMLQDDPTFHEVVEAVERSREAEKDRS
jgi:hypothetical protein